MAKTPKKRNKKYNATLNFQKISKYCAKDFRIFDITKIGVQIYRNDKPIRIGKTVAHILNEVRHRWNFVIGVLCIDSFGKKYIKQEVIESQEDYYTIEIADALNRHQVRMWNEANHNHRRTLFWIGCTGNIDEITDDWIYQEVEKMKGFDVCLGEVEIKEVA